MNSSIAAIILLALAYFTAGTPISNTNSSHNNTTNTTLGSSTTTNPTTINITMLQNKAAAEITRLYQEIMELQTFTVRHHKSYKFYYNVHMPFATG